MTEFFKFIVRKMVQNEFFWKLINVTFIPILNLMVYERKIFDTIEKNVVASRIKETALVHNGPFKGMRYTGHDSVCSTLLPKLIGSYEHEIGDVIEQICNTPYKTIFDVGCAEGYYAVGLAMRISETVVYAYDIDSKAKKLCRQMAELNGVGDRVIIDDFCSKETLMNFNFSERSLIICDCEGYERKLFDVEVAHKLKNCDFLIELHDFINISISDDIKKIFSSTHNIKCYESIDDIKKAKIIQR